MNKSQCLSIALGISLAMMTAQGNAAGKGPRASVSSSTTCSLHLNAGASLVVTTTLENKSSGNTVPEVRDGSTIEGTYKVGPGNAYNILGSVDVDSGIVDPTLTRSAEFDLCDANNGGVRAEVAGARELNGLATIYYGISGGDEDPRMVVNRCTDPYPNDGVDEGGGIKVADVIAEIEAHCPPITPP